MSNLTNKTYTQEELDIVRQYYPTHGIQGTIKALKELTGRDYTLSMVRHRARKIGVCSNNNSKFQKGVNPWNKGVSIKDTRPDIYSTYFGRNSDYVHRGFIKRAEIGTEQKRTNAVYVKVAQPNVWRTRAKVVYENTHNVKLSATDKVLHLNGNQFDDSPENLILVNNSILGRMNTYSFKYKDADLTKSMVLVEKIRARVKELEEE